MEELAEVTPAAGGTAAVAVGEAVQLEAEVAGGTAAKTNTKHINKTKVKLGEQLTIPKNELGEQLWKAKRSRGRSTCKHGHLVCWRLEMGQFC